MNENEINEVEDQMAPLKPTEENNDDNALVGYRPADGTSHCGTCAVRGGKLHVYDWLEDLPTPPDASDLVEVQFKNTRKGYFRNSTGILLKKGDIVAVESSPGHDIGEVTLMGRLVYLQMHKNHINPVSYEYRRVYRIARQTDMDKWEEAKGLEQQTMLEARSIAQDLRLNMKIGDVEYQGDRTKAIFYYIADERVDFRELIKVLAERFHVRIEMRQIGARQEAGRIGGIGSCGRELCCASWMTSFISVSTHSARIQDLSLNPMKLAGQCGKLKCCLNFELATYLDAVKTFPPTDKPLETGEGTFYFIKYDIFKKVMWYSPKKDCPINIVAVDAEHVREVQKMNAEGQKPDKLGSLQMSSANEDDGYSGTVELDEDLTRFDNKGGRRGRGGRNRNGKPGNNNRQQNGQQNGQRKPQQPNGQQQPKADGGQQQNGGQRQGNDRKPKDNRQQQRPHNQNNGGQPTQQTGQPSGNQPNGGQQRNRQPNGGQQNNGERRQNNNQQRRNRPQGDRQGRPENREHKGGNNKPTTDNNGGQKPQQ